MAKCVLCKLLLPLINCLFPFDNKQQTMLQRLPYLYTRAGGAGPAPHCIMHISAPSPLYSQSSSHRRWNMNLICNCNRKNAYPLAQQQTRMVGRWTQSPGTDHPQTLNPARASTK
eukprot:scaffold162446_cov17-Tisochrysis_lutea.AAC.1